MSLRLWGVSVGFIAWLGVGLQGLKADLGLRLSTMHCELCSIGIGDVVWLRDPAARQRQLDQLLEPLAQLSDLSPARARARRPSTP